MIDRDSVPPPHSSLICAMIMCAASWCQFAHSQTFAPKSVELAQQKIESYRLWETRATRAQSDLDDETPMLTILRPQGGRTNGAAIVIAPGGAYIGLAGMLEGVEPAAWFRARGVTAFILTYRVGPKALVNDGVSAELHAFATGPHGAGLGAHSTALSHWPELLEEWLRGRQFLAHE